MERVYSEDFILDCANPVKAINNRTLQLIRNGLSNRELEISMFGQSLTMESLERLRNGSEIENLMYKTVLAWVHARVVRPLSVEASSLPSQFSSDISAIWFKDEHSEAQLIEFLEEQQLLSLVEQDILTDEYKWLFSVTELPTIAKDTRLIWRDYLESFTHYTNKILIWDRYFLYSWNRSIGELIGGYLELNPDLELDIVSEYDSKHPSYTYAVDAIQAIRTQLGDQVRFYKLNKEGGKVFHDRFLATKYSLVKVEPGFSMVDPKGKSIRQTTPTLVGRYAEGNHKWKTVQRQWSTWIDTYCTLIE